MFFLNEIAPLVATVKSFVSSKELIAPVEPLPVELNDNTTSVLSSDLNYYKYLLEDELKANKGKFTFFHYSYPVLDIYSSATMSYEIFNSRSERQVEEALKKKVWDAVFIHIIPQPTSTEIIIGYHNNHTSRDLEEYVKSWYGLGKDEIGYKLTDLFVAHIEDWGLSPRLYEKIPEERFNRFFELQAKYSTEVIEQKTNVGYNLFEGLL